MMTTSSTRTILQLARRRGRRTANTGQVLLRGPSTSSSTTTSARRTICCHVTSISQSSVSSSTTGGCCGGAADPRRNPQHHQHHRALSAAAAVVPTSATGSPSMIIPAINVPLSEIRAGWLPPPTSNTQQQHQRKQNKSTSAIRKHNNNIIHRVTKNKNMNHNNERIFSSVASAATTTSTTTDDGDDETYYPTSLDDEAFLSENGIDREMLNALASQRATPLRLADMYKYGGHSSEQRLRNAKFLHRELPIRVAQRTMDLLTLPYGLSLATPVRQVVTLYMDYLKKLQATPVPTTPDQEEKFTDLLRSFVLDRATIPTYLARGVASWGGDRKLEGLEYEHERLQEMEDALYRFFTARVGLRFLIEHHVLSSRRESMKKALSEVTDMFPRDEEAENVDGGNNESSSSASSSLGCIQSNIDLIKETRKVSDEIIRQTTEYYGICPPIEIVDCSSMSSASDDNDGEKQQQQQQNFTYVVHHLHYMLAELIKNACRATVQQYLNEELHGQSTDPNHKLTPIRIIIVKGGSEDVTIKIADKGGGIPRSLWSTIWKFGHSLEAETTFPDEPLAAAATANGSSDTASSGSGGDFIADELSGGARIRGFGLSLARIYARYFGGELNLKSMEGYGVDAYLHLPRLGDRGENLPARVRVSPGELDSTPGKFVRHFSTAARSAGAASSAPVSATVSTRQE